MQILLDTQKCYGSSYPWSCPTALLVKKPRKKYSQHLLSATCNPDLLPSVTNSHWPPIYSNTDLVPGTTATIECFEGFHFPGTPVAINTPVPTLPTTTAPPIPISREFLKHFFVISPTVSQYIPPNGGDNRKVNNGDKLGRINEPNRDNCCASCYLADFKFTNFGFWVLGGCPKKRPFYGQADRKG